MMNVSSKAKISHVWHRDELDFYVEPPWTAERLFAVERFDGIVWDPACGGGNITTAAARAGLKTSASDIADRGYGRRLDFLTATERFPNVVSNPPYGIAERFVAHALTIVEQKVAMILPITWLAGAKRAAWLSGTPLRRVWILCPRPSMPPGAAIAAGTRVGGGTKDFAWYVWDCAWKEYQPPEIRWLHRDGGST